MNRARKKKPNVIIIMTDDQGYPNVGAHGHPFLNSPNMDRLHDEGVHLDQFHNSMLCTPSRAQLMTGRDALPSGGYMVVSGWTAIRPEVPTVAELFKAGGYATGQFGKWHLGDNYPHRPHDRGFDHALYTHGYGVDSVSEYFYNDYQDDLYRVNGKLERREGYSTDVFFGEAMRWMGEQADQKKPFIAYIATYAPHGPLWISEKHRRKYEGEKLASYFGMLENVDDNLGLLDRFLDERGLMEDTIIVYTSDHGPRFNDNMKYNAGLRGGKTSYYEAGHRVPCFMRWPGGGLVGGRSIDELTQAQDLVPTLLDLCQIEVGSDVMFDGRSLAQALRGGEQPELRERTLVVQASGQAFEELEFPKKYHCAVMRNQWRLVHGDELYDLEQDPGQQHNLASERPEVLSQLREDYEKWWARHEEDHRKPTYMVLGSDKENPAMLTSHDWLAPHTASINFILAGLPHNGPWNVRVESPGRYQLRLRRWPEETKAAIRAGLPPWQGELGQYGEGKALDIHSAKVKVGDWEDSVPVAPDEEEALFETSLPAGETQLQTWFFDADGKEVCGAYYVYVERLGD